MITSISTDSEFEDYYIWKGDKAKLKTLIGIVKLDYRLQITD